jgi:rfaE bifunctional protein kinase chain/domain/rfaE bifunctional protein nucleotidyltransferase chain/domain
MQKLITEKNLTKIKTLLKRKKKKIVLCHGVFDLLHIGHIKHFQEAKKYGDILICSVTGDKFVNKGPNRPVFNIHQRISFLESLSLIDYLIISNSDTSLGNLKKIKPDVYCKGPDYLDKKKDITKKIYKETGLVKSYGGKIIFTKDETYSSSNLINNNIFFKDDKKIPIIDKIKSQFSIDEIKNEIEKLKKLKVLIIGETIIDQYSFCEAIGKSGKEPILVFRDLFKKQYTGGIVAIAKHLSEFVKKIDLISYLGVNDEYKVFIEKNIPKNIKTYFLKKKNSPTIVKKRIIDYTSNKKIIGLYNLNDEALEPEDEKKLSRKLSSVIKKYDIVIVSDYGHGFISKKNAQLICKKAKFLSLNAQINAANIGYQTMKNYSSLNCVIINENELRHEMRDRNTPLTKLMKSLSKKQFIENLIVTRGQSGSTLYDKKKDKFFQCSAFATKIVDKVGAGDTMLSLISVMLKAKINKNLALFSSSLAAANSVETQGNSENIKKINILKSIEHLIK